MVWQFWRKGGPERVPPRVQQAVCSQFHLDPQVVSNARCLETTGVFAGKPVRHVRIFNPEALPSPEVPVLVYETLSRYPKALLFEGRIEKDGSVHLVDRRPPQRA